MESKFSRGAKGRPLCPSWLRGCYYLMDNIHLFYRNEIYRQIIGIPMGMEYGLCTSTDELVSFRMLMYILTFS